MKSPATVDSVTGSLLPSTKATKVINAPTKPYFIHNLFNAIHINILQFSNHHLFTSLCCLTSPSPLAQLSAQRHFLRCRYPTTWSSSVSNNIGCPLHATLPASVPTKTITMPSDLDQLLDMGFDKARAEIAVKKTGGRTPILPPLATPPPFDTRS